MPVLEEVLVEELQDLLSAEGQLVQALPKMSKAANDPKLKAAFAKHLEETKGHVDRLKQAFELLGEKAKAKHCKGMEGLISEGQEKIQESGEKNEFATDLALVAAAQKVEHYEISGYGTVRTIAEQLGNKKVARLLQQTLNEEEKTDALLTKLSSPILSQASEEEPEEEEEEEPEEE
ncbi:MAG TPA: ferritin-like domain-containing protein [Bryobacteraceae bacterium]|jgi:Mn-containing catalase|nr:ferritin-like domain-containing protein [Bryobacteraceae bacterium]